MHFEKVKTMLERSVSAVIYVALLFFVHLTDRAGNHTDLEFGSCSIKGYLRVSNEAPKRILIIEDEPTQRILAKEILESAGYSVRSSDDGKHGLNMAVKTRPDLIILDLMLPSLDGYSLCTSLKECEQTAHVPIILITGSKEPDVIKRGLAAGADDFVNKPVNWQFLADRVDFVLKQSAQRTTLNEEPQDIDCGRGEKDKPEKDELALTIQSLQHAADAANNKLAVIEKEHAGAIKALEAKAQDELDAQQSESAKELKKIRDQHKEQIERLTADFRSEAAEQKKRFDARLQAVEERHACEISLVNEIRNKCSGPESNSAEELSDHVGAMWQIVRAECVHYDDVLSTITGLLKTPVTGAFGEERLEKIAKQIDGLVYSVRLLKTLAVAMTEPKQESQSVFETNEFISDLADRLKQNAERNNVSIELKGLQNSIKVSAEPHRIRYALTLLSINALRLIPPSGAITVGASLADAGDIRLSISDTGLGMSPAQLDWCRNCLDNPTASPGGPNNGLGLEIPIATALARQQGGYLEIESQQGQGTSVSLVLPVDVDTDGLRTESGRVQDAQMAC